MRNIIITGDVRFCVAQAMPHAFTHKHEGFELIEQGNPNIWRYTLKSREKVRFPDELIPQHLDYLTKRKTA